STDSVADNQAMELRSPVLLDQDGMRVGRLFGATGTPMAVLADAEGKIASEVAAGAPAVLALAGQEQDKAAPAWASLPQRHRRDSCAFLPVHQRLDPIRATL